MVERFQHLISINPEALNFAEMCWTAYAANNVAVIQNLIHSIPKEFPFLKDALLAHLRRTPSAYNGLGEQEQQLLVIIAENSLSRSEVIQKFLSQDYHYGLPDLQVDKMLLAFHPRLIKMDDKLELTPLGQPVKNGEENFYPLLNVLSNGAAPF